MAEDRIDSIIHLDKIKSELDFLKKNLKDISAYVKEFPVIQTKIAGANSIRELSKENIRLSESLKAVDQLVKQRFASESKLVALQSDYAKATAANRNEIQKTNNELKIQAQYDQAQVGSIDKARAAIKKLTAERNALNLFTKEGRDRQEELNQKIDKYNEFIKKSVSLLEQQKINVGNYAGSLAKPFESLQAAIEKIKKSNATLFAAGPNGQAGRDSNREAAARQLENDLDKIFIKASREGSTATQQVKQLEAAFQKLSLAANPADKEMQKFLNAFKKEIGEAKDAVQDLKDEIKLNASDTKGIDNVVGSLNVLSGIAQGAAGAYALFGASEEDAAKVTAKLVAIQGIANSVQQVGQELTRKGTIANKAYSAVLDTLQAAFGKGATAAQRFNAILKLSVAGLVITGIIYLVNKLQELANASDKAAENQKKVNEVFKDASSAFVKASAEVTELRNKIDLAKKGIIDKKEAVKFYNETIGQTAGSVKNLKEAEEGLVKNGDAYVRVTFLKAAAQIAANKAAEKAFEIELGARQKIDEVDKDIKNGGIINDQGLSEYEKFLVKVGEKDRAARSVRQKDTKNSEVNFFKELFLSLTNEANALSKTFKITPFSQSEKSNTEARKNSVKKELDSIYEIQLLALRRSASLNEQIANDEKETYALRRVALIDYFNQSSKILDQEFEKEKLINKLKYDEQVGSLNREKKKKGADIKSINQDLLTLEENYNNQVKLIEAKRYDEGVKLSEDYSQKLEQIRNDQVKSEIKLSEKLQENSAGFLQVSIDNDKRLREEAFKEEQELVERRKELYRNLYDEIKEAFISFIDGQFDRQKNEVQASISLAEEEKNQKIRAINELFISDKEKAEKTAVIEEVAQTKKEQLERKQKEIDARKAQFDKAAAILNIGIDTARGVAAIKIKLAEIVAKAAAAFPLSAVYSPAIALTAAQIPLTIAIGAAQAAAVAARPIPKFKHGKNNDYQGPAFVDDGGRNEPIYRADTGQIELSTGAPKDRITFLKRKDVVFPSIEAMMNRIVLPKLVPIKDNAGPIHDMQGVINAINSINIKTTTITKEGWREHAMKLEQYNDWVNKTIKN